MIGQKGKKTLAELMQFGYERNVIALPTMRGNKELEQKFEEMNHRIIKSVWNFYNTTDRAYGEDHKHWTAMRFCFVIGIGAAWFWENNKEEVDTKGLYECMAGPRGENEMDEYIEDVVGIWWSYDSHEHRKYSLLHHGYMDIIQSHYDLTSKQEEISAGHVMMLFGMYCGYSRLIHELTIKPYKGEMPWHWEVWKVLYGEEAGEHLDKYNEWAYKAYEDGVHGLGVNVIYDDPNSKFGKINKFCHPFTYHEKAGMKTLVLVEDDDQAHMISATPIFETSRNCHLVIDNVYVWENGVEATIEAHYYDDEGRHVTFYDTNYLENKERYYVGMDYTFDLYGIAYQVKVVPEEERSFKFEGEKAVNFNKKMGHETEYDENGIPEPVIFYTGELHSFFQSKDKLPEDASFRSPIKAVYDDIDYLGKKVYEVVIGLPYHDVGEHDEKHLISVFIAAETNDMVDCRPSVGDPIQGVIYLQGKMRDMINWQECPSTILHTFDAKSKMIDGKDAIFAHDTGVCEGCEDCKDFDDYEDCKDCKKGGKGLLMTDKEQQEFAQRVFFQQFWNKLKIAKDDDSKDNDMPDFYADRMRDIWVKPDVNYTAATDFIEEDKEKYLAQAYSNHRIPIIVYVSLYDINGNICQWTKGGEYTAKFHYGSVLPGQKMEATVYYDHDDLVELLFESFKNLDTRYVAKYLHNDLDFRSDNLADPIICRQEYLIRSESVNNANKKAKEGPVKPELITDEPGHSYIELHYPKGNVDVVKVDTKGGFITSIRIENKIFGKASDS